MKYAKSLGLLLVAALLLGCGTSAQPKKEGGKKNVAEMEDHVHGKGPNGGVVFDFDKYHAEFTVDHDKKQCMVLILGNDEKTPKTLACKDLTVITKETKTKDGTKVAPMTIKMEPKDEKDGKASKYVGTDPGLGNVADFEGNVVGEVDGKHRTGKFKE